MESTVYEWNQDRLGKAISGLPAGRGRWFAAFAAARLHHRLADANNDHVKRELRTALVALADPATGVAALQSLLGKCEGLVQDEDAEDYDSDPVADNAVVATCYALEAALGDQEAVIWAATQAHEAVDYMAHSELDADFNDAEQMRQVASHQVVQEELAAQEADLVLLRTAEGSVELANRAMSYLA